jgi:hypothetical protein
MDYNIALLIMPPHSSHLTQPLDVSVFGPLSIAHGRAVDRLGSTGIARISKAKWVDIYVGAHDKAFTKKNILSAWKNAGLEPFGRYKVLKHVEAPPTPKCLTRHLTNSLPDQTKLLEQNRKLRAALSHQEPLNTPLRNHATELADATERLTAQVALLRQQNSSQCAVLGARKKQRSGKRVALKSQFLVTTKEILKAVKKAEQETAHKKQAPKGAKRKRPATPSEEEEESDEEEESSNTSNTELESKPEEEEIGDMIVCQFS